MRVEDGKLIFEGGTRPESDFDLGGAGISYVRMESNDWTDQKIDQNFWLKSDESDPDEDASQ